MTALRKITEIKGQAISAPGDDVDTDRIIPASYMKCVTFDGLGKYLFHDVRYDGNGNATQHPLNDPQYASASIMVVGNNFGCGSSREHAPQAIYRAGFRAIIGEGFAEIFFGNATTLGIPCVCLKHKERVELSQIIEADPSVEVVVDLKKREIRAGKKKWPFDLRDTARKVLINGKFDTIGELLEGLPQVEKTEASLPR